MKKSIALFSVLAFLIIVFALLNAIFDIYEKNYKITNFNQTSVMVKDIFTLLNNFSEDINKNNIKFLFNSFLISSKDGKFREIITIKPIFNKINLNEYLANNKINSSIDTFLNNLLEKYQTLDPQYFKDLLLDSLDSDTLERESNTEDLNINSKIYTFKQFKKIIDFYAKEKNDKSIFKIPFKKYIYFYPQNTPIICEFIDKKLLDLLNLTIDTNCTSTSKENLKKIKELDIIPYKLSTNLLIKIKTTKFNMIYDLKQKRIIKLENHPVY